MDFTLRHFQFIDGAAGGCLFYPSAAPRSDAALLLNDLPAECVGPLTRHREINWPQTFARRAIKFADFDLLYRDFDGKSPGRVTHYFKHHATPLQPPRHRCTKFVQEGHSESILQGDILTYWRTDPTYSLKLLAEKSYFLEKPSRELLNEPFFLDTEAVLRIRSHLVTSLAVRDFEEHFIRNRNRLLSLVSLQH
jgi:hypothetical protein